MFLGKSVSKHILFYADFFFLPTNGVRFDCGEHGMVNNLVLVHADRLYVLLRRLTRPRAL